MAVGRVRFLITRIARPDRAGPGDLWPCGGSGDTRAEIVGPARTPLASAERLAAGRMVGRGGVGRGPGGVATKGWVGPRARFLSVRLPSEMQWLKSFQVLGPPGLDAFHFGKA